MFVINRKGPDILWDFGVGRSVEIWQFSQIEFRVQKGPSLVVRHSGPIRPPSVGEISLIMY